MIISKIKALLKFALLTKTLDWLVLKFMRYEVKLKTVLIIRIDAIGDFVLWLDSAKELRKLYPKGQYKITLLGNKTWTQLAESLGYFDIVLPIDRRNFLSNPFYRFRILKSIRSSGFEIAIQPTYSREFFEGDTIIRLSGAKERIGSQGDYSNISGWQKRISDSWYTKLIRAADEPLVELQRNVEFMHGLGLINFQLKIPTLQVLAPNETFTYRQNYYILFPGASSNIKQWPLENFRLVAERLHAATGWMGLICGGKGEEYTGEKLLETTSVPVRNLIGKTSLVQLSAIINNACLLIGNDTSAIHISAAMSTPSVCILGGGHFGRFMPYPKNLSGCLPLAVYRQMACFGCNWHCNQPHASNGPVPCISNIPVDAVVAAINQVLSCDSCKTKLATQCLEKKLI